MTLLANSRRKTHLVRKQGSLRVSGRDANDEHISWATYCGNNGSMVHAPSCWASWWRRRTVGISWRNNHQSRKINKYYNMTTMIPLKDSNFKPGIFKDLTFYSSHYSLLFSSVQEPLEMKDFTWTHTNSPAPRLQTVLKPWNLHICKGGWKARAQGKWGKAQRYKHSFYCVPNGGSMWKMENKTFRLNKRNNTQFISCEEKNFRMP